LKLGLENRLLILTLLVLGVSLSLAGWVFDRSFRASILAGAEEQMRLVIFSVMGAVDEDDDGLYVGNDASQPRLSLPASGIYAMVAEEAGDELWVSPSARLSGVVFPSDLGGLGPGDFRFVDGRDAGIELFFLSYAVIWEASEEVELLFRVGVDSQPFIAQVQQFRRNLWIGLAGVAGLLVLVQLVAVRVGLRPVRVMADEVAQMEAGTRASLSGDYPRELTGLAANLDRFVEHETASRARYRNALDDLAHSLKTPLAVLRNELADRGEIDRALMREQLSRMENTVGHQLSRAVSSGPVVVGHLVNVVDVAQRLARALQKAYSARELEVDIRGDSSLAFRGDERDLMELLGNLLENAFKYTHGAVQFDCAETSNDKGLGIILWIDDDGPGMPLEQHPELLARGARGDTLAQGQGIGLSVVTELVSLYGGRLELQTGPLGGARVLVELPGQST